jgi:hypothetical protein
MSGAGMDARTLVGLTGRLTATESIAQFLAGGTGIVGYVLINIRDTGYRQKNLYMRRGVGSKGQLNQAPKEPRLFKSFQPTDSPLKTCQPIQGAMGRDALIYSLFYASIFTRHPVGKKVPRNYTPSKHSSSAKFAFRNPIPPAVKGCLKTPEHAGIVARSENARTLAALSPTLSRGEREV